MKIAPGVGKVPCGLSAGLSRDAGFRNVLVHACETLDLRRVHEAATRGPQDLRRFLGIAA